MTRVVHLLALLALTLAVAACGGADVAVDPVAEAATKTRAAGSSRVEVATTVTTAGRKFAVRGAGAFDYASERATMTYDLSQLAGGRVELRFDQTVLYLRMPQLQAMLPEGKSWLKLDVAAAARDAEFGQLAQLGGQDPSQLLEYLRSLDATPTEVGRSRVRGVATTHYSARVSLQKALDEGLKGMPKAKRRAARQELRTMIEHLGTSTMPVDVWIDSDDRVRRLKTTYSFRMPPARGGSSTSVATAIDFFDFGVDVAVVAPPAAAIVDATRFVPRAAG